MNGWQHGQCQEESDRRFDVVLNRAMVLPMLKLLFHHSASLPAVHMRQFASLLACYAAGRMVGLKTLQC